MGRGEQSNAFLLTLRTEALLLPHVEPPASLPCSRPAVIHFVCQAPYRLNPPTGRAKLTLSLLVAYLGHTTCGEQPARQRGAKTFPLRAPADEGSSADGLGLPQGLMPFLYLGQQTSALSGVMGQGAENRQGMPAASGRRHCSSSTPVTKELAMCAHHFATFSKDPQATSAVHLLGPIHHPPLHSFLETKSLVWRAW